MDEPAMVQVSNGSVLVNMRHRSESALGRGFSVGQFTTFWNKTSDFVFSNVYYKPELYGPVCQGSFVNGFKEPYEKIVLFSNPMTRGKYNNPLYHVPHDQWEKRMKQLEHEWIQNNHPIIRAGRSDIGVRISYDDGNTFPQKILLYKPAASGYSCMVQGSVMKHNDPLTGGILYEARSNLFRSVLVFQLFQIPKPPVTSVK